MLGGVSRLSKATSKLNWDKFGFATCSSTTTEGYVREPTSAIRLVHCRLMPLRSQLNFLSRFSRLRRNSSTVPLKTALACVVTIVKKRGSAVSLHSYSFVVHQYSLTIPSPAHDIQPCCSLTEFNPILLVLAFWRCTAYTISNF